MVWATYVETFLIYDYASKYFMRNVMCDSFNMT